MTSRINCDIAVVGAGSGGLMVAAGAAMLGRDVVLIERAQMGGDCLNHGCVPSKALLAAAHRAMLHRDAAGFGLDYAPPRIDFSAVMRHVRGTIRAIAPHDSAERYEGLGVKVLHGMARFRDADTLELGGTDIRARRIVLATGAAPVIPPIPGIEPSGYMTNRNLFDLLEQPAHLMIIGGGPMGLEMAQAFRRLGSRVTVIEQNACLSGEDAEIAAYVLDSLRHDGIEFLEQRTITRIEHEPVLRLFLSDGSSLEGTHLLLACGRRAETEHLDLARAGIALGPRGIQVDAQLRTTNPRVYAVGDATGLHDFTHTAAYHAGLVLRHALFRLPVRADHETLPRALYTDPEFAAAGLTEAQARARHGDIRVLRADLAENDRGRAERQRGLVKAITAPSGKLLGVSIAGPHAAELIQPWLLPLQKRRRIHDLQAATLPYPTLGEASKRAAGEFFKPKLNSPVLRGLASVMARLG